MRTGRVWLKSKEEFQEIIDRSSSFLDVLKELNLNSYNGNHRTLKKRIIEENINLDKLKNNRKILYSKRTGKKTEPENVLKENSTCGRGIIKKIIIRNNLIEYKCLKCGNNGTWENEKITLQLEHKNGINDDNRIENLCFLCPNCHSQTKTFSGRNSKGTRYAEGIKYYCKCGEVKGRLAKLCTKCHRENIKATQTKVLGLTKEKLENMIKEKPIIEIAKELGVSDTTIRHYAIKMGIDYKSLSKFSHRARL
jgi:Zn finger protein HypA/HybF involved in hydrogenase expression